MKNWQSRCPESSVEMEAIKTEIAMGHCIKSDLERMGKMIERRNWRLLTENVVTTK